MPGVPLPTSKLDIAYVVRSPNPVDSVNASFILYRNSDTKTRFLADGTLLPEVVEHGCWVPVGGTSGEAVEPFKVMNLTREYGEYHLGYYYYLFMATFDPRRHAGTYQLRVNVSGLVGGSSWERSNGNPNVPWTYFRLPSEAKASISPFTPGGHLGASARVNITGKDLPLGVFPKSHYGIYIDCKSFANGTYHGASFFKNGSQLWRGLDPGLHTLTLVCEEVEVTTTFETRQWEVEVQASPNVTIPGGRQINITGSGFPPNEAYSIFLGTNEEPILSGAISSFGNFSTSYRFPKGTPLGPHYISAVATQIAGRPTATVAVTLDPWAVNLTVTPTTLHQGEWLDINCSDYPIGADLEIYLDGRSIYEGRVDENGTFYCRVFTLSDDFLPGIHIISANATDYGGPPSGKVEIEVVQFDVRISLDPDTTNPGRHIFIRGLGFPSNEIVEIKLLNQIIGQAVTDWQGSFQAYCQVPRNSTLGTHYLLAYATNYGGPPTGNSTLTLVQWPIEVELNPSAPHPGGWVSISGTGLPPDAAYAVFIGKSTILQGVASSSGEFHTSPSLPQNISIGPHRVDLVVKEYTGQPVESFTLNITEWTPQIYLDPASPRPGETLRIFGIGFPRGGIYDVSLDGLDRGSGITDGDGTFSPYIFLERNLSLGIHRLNLTISFPGFNSTIIDFVVAPWKVGLNLTPRSGIGEVVQAMAYGCPPNATIRVFWDDVETTRGYTSMDGTYGWQINLDLQGDESFHVVSVQCDGNYSGQPRTYAFFYAGELPPDPDISGCNESGEDRSTFYLNEAIYVKGSGLPPLIGARINLLNGSSNGGIIHQTTAFTDEYGGFLYSPLPNATSQGDFTLWLDLNANDVRDCNDLLSNSTLRVRPRPQIAVTSISPEKSIVTWGEVLRIESLIQNLGGSSEDIVVNFKFGSQLVGTATAELSPHAQTTVTLDWDTSNTKPDSRILEAEVDALPGEEEVTDNRVSAGHLTVRPAPSIAIESLVPNKRTVKRGSVVTLTVGIHNLGEIMQEFEIEVLWGDSIVASQTMNLASRSTILESIDWDTSDNEPGEGRIRVRTTPIPHEANPLDNDLAAGSITILAPNSFPVAFVPLARHLIAGLPVAFNGSLSRDEDGVISAYLWDFGDNSSEVGVVVNHTYLIPGTYEICLTVTDDDGASSTYWKTVDVLDPGDFEVWPSDPLGNFVTEFRRGEPVYATVTSPDTFDCGLYVLSQGASRSGRLLLGTNEAFAHVFLDGSETVEIWQQSVDGIYDLILDLDSNGRFNPDIDPIFPSFFVAGGNNPLPVFLLILTLLYLTIQPSHGTIESEGR